MSIVIPTHDTRELTVRCVRSILGVEADPDLEIMIVDDGSSDGTAEAVGSLDPRVRVLRNPAPLGFSSAANRGLDSARGDLLLLLNSDTELLGHGTTAARALLRDREDVGIVGASLQFPSGKPQWSGGAAPGLAWLFVLSSGAAAILRKIPFYRAARPLDASRERRVAWVTGAAMMMSRGVWHELRPLDERYEFYGQDLDLCTRAGDRGWRVVISPEFRVLHHLGASVGKSSGSVGSQNPALILRDLLRWASFHRSRRWARWARRTMVLGLRLRIAARTLTSRSSGGDRGREATESYRRALRSISRAAPEADASA